MRDKIWKEMFCFTWHRTTFIEFLLDAGLAVNGLNKNGITMLSYAAECGNLEMTEFLVQKGADVNVANSDGSKPLHIATKYGRKDIVKFLLNGGIPVDSCIIEKCTPYVAAERDIIWKSEFDSMWRIKGTIFIQFLIDAGLDVNTLNKYGATMLSYAAERGNLEMTEFLLQKGADANVVNADGSKPLHVAAKYGQKDIVKLYLNRGIYVDSCDNDKFTPLHYVAAQKNIMSSAAGENYQELVVILLDHNANINAVNGKGCTPLLLAAQKGPNWKHMVELFIKLGADLKFCDENQWTVLHHACRAGLTGLVQTLVEERLEIDLNAKNSDGDVPVIIAAKYSRVDIVKLLVDSGVNVKYQNQTDWTLLHYACIRGWFSIVKSLVNKECDLNEKDCMGRTPLTLAASDSQSSVVEYLIECGANVRSCDDDGTTVLHYACKEGWLDIVKSLVSKGCDLNAKGFRERTPLFQAAYSRSSVFEYLIECGADVDVCDAEEWTVLHYACEGGWLEAVKTLVSKGCDVNAKDCEGGTPMIVAALFSNPHVVEYLVECGADVDICDVEEWTVLHYACERGWLEVVKSLVKKGCDLSALNADLHTPLHLAVRFHRVEILKHLLSAGADCNVQNNRGKTAFSMFIESSLNLEVIILFIESGAYFQTDDYAVISNNSLLKANILQNTELCTEVLINRFNNADLRKMYEIPGFSEKLPSIEKLKISNQGRVAQNIAESVKYEIQTKGFCNVLNMHPIVLNMLCVETLMEHFDS